MKTQEELLKAMSQRDLVDLCMRFGIDPPGQGERRAATAGRLLDALRDDPDLTAHCLGYETVCALRDGLPKGRGEVEVPLGLRADPYGIAEHLPELRRYGLAWRDRRCWHVLPEARKLTRCRRDLMDDLETEQRILEQINVALNRYGTAPIDVVMAGAPEEGGTSLSVLLMLVYSRFYGLSGFAAGPDGRLWMRSQDCDEPQLTMAAQQACGSLGLDWEPTGIGGAEAFMDTFVPLKADAVRLLYDIAGSSIEHEDQMEWVSVCVEDAFFLLQDGDRRKALDCLCDILPENRITEANRWLMDRFLNRFPVWALRGHSMSGISANRLPESLRIDPGEPCPCGSGRPWRKCHGRMN